MIWATFKTTTITFLRENENPCSINHKQHWVKVATILAPYEQQITRLLAVLNKVSHDFLELELCLWFVEKWKLLNHHKLTRNSRFAANSARALPSELQALIATTVDNELPKWSHFGDVVNCKVWSLALVGRWATVVTHWSPRPRAWREAVRLAKSLHITSIHYILRRWRSRKWWNDMSYLNRNRLSAPGWARQD